MPATAEYVDIVRLNLYGIASKMGFSYEEIEDMKVAISEACNNSVLHAYQNQTGVMEIAFEIHGDALSITVRDEGESFENWQPTEPDQALHNKDLSNVEIGGLGFYLMQALMDDVCVNREVGHGTSVTMTRKVVKSEETV
ncbi:Serine-protein kinase RsbW [compost metagenome]